MNPSIRIRNSVTKEVKEIPLNEAGNYGIGADKALGIYESQQKLAKTIETGQVQGEQTTEQINKAEARKTMKAASQAILDTVGSIERGELTGQEAQDAIDFVAGKDYESVFEVAGTQLTSTERAILQGTKPTIEEQKGNILQRARGIVTGRVPPQTGRVIDTPEELKRKAALSIEYLSAAERGETPDVQAALEAVRSVGKQSEEGFSLKGMGKNIIAGQQAIGEGLGRLALTGITAIEPPGGERKARFQEMGLPVSREEAIRQIGEMAVNLPDAIVKQYVDIAKNPIGEFYQDPTGTTLAVLPLVPAVAKVKSAVTGKLTKIVGSDLAGRAATSVAVPTAESVVKSEKIMKDALQITRANTVRGVARELDDFIPKANAYIDSEIAPVSQKIGSLSRAEAIEGAKVRLSTTDVGRTNTKLVNSLLVELENKLDAGNLPGGGTQGATTLERINDSRKFLNSQVSPWYKRGSQLSSEADQYSFLRAEASKYLRDYLTGTEGLGDNISNAISLQHSALEALPSISERALGKLPGSKLAAIKAALGPFEIALGRRLQGVPPEIMQRILGFTPEESAVAEKAVVGPSTTRPFLTQPLTIEEMAAREAMTPPGFSTIEGAPTSGQTLYRDLRYQQGNPRFRSIR